MASVGYTILVLLLGIVGVASNSIGIQAINTIDHPSDTQLSSRTFLYVLLAVCLALLLGASAVVAMWVRKSEPLHGAFSSD